MHLWKRPILQKLAESAEFSKNSGPPIIFFVQCQDPSQLGTIMAPMRKKLGKPWLRVLGGIGSVLSLYSWPLWKCVSCSVGFSNPVFSYGLRYTAKVLRDALQEKFPQATEEDLYKVSSTSNTQTHTRFCKHAISTSERSLLWMCSFHIQNMYY